MGLCRPDDLIGLERLKLSLCSDNCIYDNILVWGLLLRNYLYILAYEIVYTFICDSMIVNKEQNDSEKIAGEKQFF